MQNMTYEQLKDRHESRSKERSNIVSSEMPVTAWAAGGAVAGGSAGGATGSVFPGVGTAVGIAGGGGTGFFTGASIGYKTHLSNTKRIESIDEELRNIARIMEAKKGIKNSENFKFCLYLLTGLLALVAFAYIVNKSSTLASPPVP